LERSGAFRELEFPGGVAAETTARDPGMLEALAHGRSCFAEVAAREVLFERRGANGDAIEFNGCARRVAGDLEFVGKDRRWAGE